MIIWNPKRQGNLGQRVFMYIGIRDPNVPISRKENGGIKESKMIYVYSKRNL